MLAFREAITCLKKALKRLWYPFKDQELKLEFGKSKAKAWELYQTLCEFVGGICWDFFMYFCSLLLGKKILLGFFGFCIGTFPILWT